MYELFYADRTAAMGTRVVLEEIGAEYRLIETDITDHAPRAPEFLALNPNGWVPVLVYEGGSMHEASAITVFLADRHPEAGLAPAADDPCGDPSFSGSSTCPTPCRWPISSRTTPGASAKRPTTTRARGSDLVPGCGRSGASSIKASKIASGCSAIASARRISICSCSRPGSVRTGVIRRWKSSRTPHGSPPGPRNGHRSGKSTNCE